MKLSGGKRARAARHLLMSALIALCFIGHAARWWTLPLVDATERLLYDWRLRLDREGGVDQRIVIVDIDERSLAEEGRWPWPRQRLADLVEALHGHYHVGLLGFDVVFAEQDRADGLAQLQALAAREATPDTALLAGLDRLRKQLDADTRLARALAGGPSVLGYYFSLEGAKGPGESLTATLRSGALPAPAFDDSVLDGQQIFVPRATGYSANLPDLQAVAAGAGHFNPTIDPDGVIRRVPLMVEFEDRFFPSLALEMARVAAGGEPAEPGFAPGFWAGRRYPALEWLSLGKLRIPVDLNGQALVPYRGGRGSFPYISAADVLSRKVDPAQLAGRIVLLGTSAPGLLDLRASPVGPAYPGVEIHANLLAGILDGALLQAPAYTVGAEVCLLAIFAVLAGLASLLPDARARWAAFALLGAAWLGLNLFAWQAGDFVLPLAGGIFMLTPAFVLPWVWGHWVEDATLRRWQDGLGRHLSASRLEDLAQGTRYDSLVPRRQPISVMAVQLAPAGSAPWPDDAPALAAMLASCFEPLVDVVHAHGGTFDRYLPRGFLAFWGAPGNAGNHAATAFAAAVALRACRTTLLERCAARGWPGVSVVVAVAEGPAWVGWMGAPRRQEYGVEGEVVEWALRLVTVAPNYGLDLLALDSVREANPEEAWQEVDRVTLAPGAAHARPVWTPQGPRATLDPALRADLRLLRETLKAFRAREWDAAEVNFLNLRRNPRLTRVVDVYLKRIAFFRQYPPDDTWDGRLAAEPLV